MKAVVIGGCGHIGTYLIPRLLENGFEVINVTRGKSKPYKTSGIWTWVQSLMMDRAQEEKEGCFGRKIAALDPDIVVDLIAYNVESLKQIVQALEGKVGQYVYCSSIWAHGSASTVPAPEILPSTLLAIMEPEKRNVRNIFIWHTVKADSRKRLLCRGTSPDRDGILSIPAGTWIQRSLKRSGAGKRFTCRISEWRPCTMSMRTMWHRYL